MADSPGFTIGPAEDASAGFTVGPAEDAPSGFSLDEGKAPSDTYILNLVGDPFYIPTYEEYLAYDKARNRESVPFIKTVGEAAEMAWNDITGFFAGLVNLGAEGEVGQMAAALGEGAARGTADLGQLVRKGIYDNIQYAIGDDADDYKTFLATRELDAMRERARRGDESLMFELIPEANRVAEGFSYVADPSVFVPGLGVGSKAVTKGASAATRGVGHTVAGLGRLIQKPADALASRAGDLAATAEAATMRRPGLGMSTAQTAGGVGRSLETMGELFKEAGKQMEKAPSRVGLLRSIEYSADAAENIRKLAGRGARVLDPGLSAIGKLGEGVITGATVGGVLGGLAEGERGIYSGLGAGSVLGGTATTIAGVGGKVTGLANRAKRKNDYGNWLKQFDLETQRRIHHYVGDNLNSAAEVMGIDDLGVGVMGKDTVIEYLTEAEARAAKAEWHERETGEKIDPDSIPDFRGVEFLDSTTEGQVPRILINVEHKAKPGHTLAHEVFHSLNKLDGMQDYIARLNQTILGTTLEDGTLLREGLFTPDQFADLADQYASRFLKEAPRRGKKTKKGVTVKDKKGKFTKESVDVYNKFKNDKVRILEEIGAEFFASLLSGKPDYLVPGKGMDSLTRQAMDSLLLADSNSRIGRMQKILDASFGKIFKWDKVTGESELFSINGEALKGSPMINALMRDMIRAKRAIRDRMDVAPGKRREVEIKPLNTPQEGLKKFINRHKDHPIANLFETDKKGRIKPKKIADTHQEEVELSNKIADAIESVADDGDPKTMRTSTDEKGNSIFKGQRFSPKQMEAIKNTPGINNKVLEYLEMLNELIGEGRQIDLEYYAATRSDRQGRRRYSSGIKQSRRLVVPYSIEVSRAGNFLVRALDASKLGDKIDGWKKSRKKWVDSWTNTDELYADLARYLQNLASPAPEPSAKLFGEKKRNILNELMGARGRTGFNPLALEKMAEKDFLVRSFRVDRVTEMNLDAGLPGLKGEKIPYGEQSYALQKENYMPADNPGLDILKGAGKPSGLPRRPTVLQIAKYFQERFGKQVDYTKNDLEGNQRFEDALFDETIHALDLHPEAAGWYDENIKLAFDVLREIDPDIAKPENELIFKAVLAVTSDGNVVESQFMQTWDIYQDWKKKGRLDKSALKFASGTNVGAIRKKIVLIQSVADKLGPKKTAEWLTTKGTVGDLRKAAVKDLGMDPKQAKKLGTGELVDEVVPYAIIFGPKLGSFFNNLYGVYDTVTMDRWFMRTVGRNTGTQVAKIPKEVMTRAKSRLKKAVDSLTTAERKSLGITKNDGAVAKAGETAKKLAQIFLSAKARDALSEKGHELRKAANTLDKMAKPLVEAPLNGKHRRWIRDRVKAVQDRLKNKNIFIENADLQALLWYGEKELYESVGYRSRSAAADYAAASEILHTRILGGPSGSYATGTGRVGTVGRSGGAVQSPDTGAKSGGGGVDSANLMPAPGGTRTEKPVINLGDGFSITPEAGVNFIPAFHGTPHDVSRFSTDYIGTGEGIQAYGYGLYFAEDKGTGEWYRRTLTGDYVGSRLSYNDINLGGWKADRNRRLVESVDSLLDKNDEWKLKNNKGWETVTRYDLEEMFQDASHFSTIEEGDKHFSYDDKKSPYYGPEGASEAWRRLRKDFKAKEGGQEGNIYKVDLDIKDDEFLDFNGPVPKRLFKMLGDSWVGNKPTPRASDMVVRERSKHDWDPAKPVWDIVDQKTDELFSGGLSLEGAKADLADLTQAKVDDVYKSLIKQDLEMMPGERFYHMLSSHLADQQRHPVTPAQAAKMSDREISQALAKLPKGSYLASMALAKEGIYGLRYPGAMAPGNRDYTNSNYVVFDDSKIRIEEKNGNRIDPSEINEANFMPSDQDYLAAVDKGDTGAAQAMVDQAAKKAGHKGPYFHGSERTGEYNKFKPGWQGQMFFSENKEYSDRFGDVNEFYLKSDRVLDFVNNPEHQQKAIDLFNKEGGWSERIEDGDIEPRDYRFDPSEGDEIWEIFHNLDAGVTSKFDQIPDIEKYDGIVFEEDPDTIAHAVFDPSQIKSAEPVTRDDDGNVIPLSERFNPGEDDFRYMPADQAFSKAKETFGTTRDPLEAGYVLPGGEMLDFSGRHEGSDERDIKGQRYSDHREISQIGTEMTPFVDLGAVRIDARSGLIELGKEPTASQLSVIKRIVEDRGSEVHFDLRDSSRPDYQPDRPIGQSLQPEPGTDPKRVIGLIRRFYRGDDISGAAGNFMPATEADSRIPSRVPAKPVVSNRSPMLQWLAQSFIEKGLIDKEDWDTAVNSLSPVDAKRSQIPDAFKVGQVNQNYPMVLDSVKQEKFVDVLLGEGPKEGTSVGLRIDIKAFENSLAKVASGELDFPVYVVAIHSEGSAKSIGKDIEGYSAIAAVSNPTFLIGSEKGSLAIAAGKPKTTLATVEGEWMPLSEVPNVTGEGWTRVGMDPTRHSYFYDKASGQPIKGGSLAISFGNTVFVRDAIPMTPEEASGVLYMPAKEVGGSTVYKGEDGARVIKTKSGKYRVYGANKALLGIASSEKTAERILQGGTKKVSVRVRSARGLAGVGGS